jgi:protein TonB
MATTKLSAERMIGSDLCFSNPKREKGTTAEAFSASVVFHTVIVAAATWLTIAPPKKVESEAHILIPVLQEEKAQQELPPPPPPPTTREQPPQMTDAPRGFQTLTVPTYITPEIPPPTAGPEIDEADFTGEGVEGGRGRGRVDPNAKIVDADDVSAAPAFTPYTVAPELRNRSEVARLLERLYPPLIRDAGIGGTVMMWVFIDQHGAVRKVQVKESSGLLPLDSAAVRVSTQMKFSPAQNRDIKVPVWVALPVKFTVAM